MHGDQRIHHTRLRHPTGVSPILTGHGILDDALGQLGDWLAGRTLFVISSPEVRRLHGSRLDARTGAARERVDLDVPEGEAAKTLEVAGSLWSAMLERGGKRDSRVVAFGGGSVCDLAGFVAGCFLRGVEFAYVPTTLLAQVDAAIGGKVAVDLPGGKNTVGLFRHPRMVVNDTALLGTLPRGEVCSGLVEVVKSALILDAALFREIEEHVEEVLALREPVLTRVVAAGAAMKARVVEEDPVEGDRRRLLNLGHTLGHAIESALGYTGLRHGEAVAYGLLFVLRLAHERGLDRPDPELFGRLRALLRRLDLPPLPVSELRVDDLVERLGRDKKATEAGLVWILPAVTGPGTAEGRMVADVTTGEVRRHLPPFLADPFGA